MADSTRDKSQTSQVSSAVSRPVGELSHSNILNSTESGTSAIVSNNAAQQTSPPAQITSTSSTGLPTLQTSIAIELSSSSSETTTLTTSPPSTSLSDDSRNSTGSTATNTRLSNGTISGIAVGIAVGIAIITFLVTFFSMRARQGSAEKQRRTHSKSQAALSSSLGGDSPNGFSGAIGPATLENKVAIPAVEGYCPTSADDKTVQDQVTTLLDQIALHVENFYHGSIKAQGTPLNPRIEQFKSPHLPQQSLSLLLSSSKTSIAAITHVLTLFVTSSIIFTSRPEISLLPAQFNLVPTKTTRRRANSDCVQAMFKWRILTAYLCPQPAQDSGYISQRDVTIQEMVETFSETFSPWKNPQYNDQQRRQSLSAVLAAAADLGIWIFSQPSNLEFLWSKPQQSGSKKIAVSPALIKTTDANGRALAQPRVMVDAVFQ